MSRILAESAVADLCGRLFNWLLFVLLIPFILLLAILPRRKEPVPVPGDVQGTGPQRRPFGMTKAT